MFGQLNPSLIVNQLQMKFDALFSALEDLESAYQWSAAYSLSDFEAAPLSFPAADGQDVLNALADAHDLYQTALGTSGFPTATPPYNFLASMRVVTGAR
jgi:hypothetical protein